MTQNQTTAHRHHSLPRAILTNCCLTVVTQSWGHSANRSPAVALAQSVLVAPQPAQVLLLALLALPPPPEPLKLGALVQGQPRQSWPSVFRAFCSADPFSWSRALECQLKLCLQGCLKHSLVAAGWPAVAVAVAAVVAAAADDVAADADGAATVAASVVAAAVVRHPVAWGGTTACLQLALQSVVDPAGPAVDAAVVAAVGAVAVAAVAASSAVGAAPAAVTVAAVAKAAVALVEFRLQNLLSHW